MMNISVVQLLIAECMTAQMAHGLQQIRQVIGYDIPDLTDESIQETLWFYYFDVAKSITYLLSELHHHLQCDKAKGEQISRASRRREMALQVQTKVIRQLSLF